MGVFLPTFYANLYLPSNMQCRHSLTLITGSWLTASTSMSMKIFRVLYDRVAGLTNVKFLVIPLTLLGMLKNLSPTGQAYYP